MFVCSSLFATPKQSVYQRSVHIVDASYPPNFDMEVIPICLFATCWAHRQVCSSQEYGRGLLCVMMISRMRLRLFASSFSFCDSQVFGSLSQDDKLDCEFDLR